MKNTSTAIRLFLLPIFFYTICLVATNISMILDVSLDVIHLRGALCNGPLPCPVASDKKMVCRNIAGAAFNVTSRVKQDGLVYIPGGGTIPCQTPSDPQRKKRSSSLQYPEDMLQYNLQPHLKFPAHEKVYYRRWPLKLTNTDHGFLVTPEKPCPKDTTLLILVHSDPQAVAERDDIRHTWASVVGNASAKWPGTNVTYPQVRSYFVLGQDKTGKYTLDKLQKENKLHQDIILADFIDDYFNLTMKSLMALKWTSKFCRHVPFIFKTTSNMFLDIPALVKLTKKTQGKAAQNSIVGSVLRNQKVQWGVPHPHNQRIPKERFPFTSYPDYTAGLGYLISGDMCSKLLDLAQFVPLIHRDDVFITGILRKILKIGLMNEPCLDATRHKEKKSKVSAAAFHERHKCIEEVHKSKVKTVIWNQLKKMS